MNVLSRGIFCQVRLGVALYLRNASALFFFFTHPPSPEPCHCEGKNSFQKVAPFTVRDVGCCPIFHSRLSVGYILAELLEISSKKKSALCNAHDLTHLLWVSLTVKDAHIQMWTFICLTNYNTYFLFYFVVTHYISNDLMRSGFRGVCSATEMLWPNEECALL